MSPKWWWIFGLDLFFSGVFLCKYSVFFCWLLAVKRYQKKICCRLKSLWAFGLTSVLFVWSHQIWEKLVQNDKKQLKPTWCCFHGTKLGWECEVATTTCQEKLTWTSRKNRMQDAKGENHHPPLEPITMVMIFSTFSTLRHLWCSHHSAFVKSLPIFFIATFKSGSQRAGIDSMYFLACAPHGLACCDVFPAPFWLVV